MLEILERSFHHMEFVLRRNRWRIWGPRVGRGQIENAWVQRLSAWLPLLEGNLQMKSPVWPNDSENKYKVTVLCWWTSHYVLCLTAAPQSEMKPTSQTKHALFRSTKLACELNWHIKASLLCHASKVKQLAFCFNLRVFIFMLWNRM